MKDEKNVKISQLNQIYGGILTEKQRAVLERFYDCDCSLAEISEEFGISRQAVLDAVKKSEETLLKTEEKLGFLSVKQKLRDCVKELEKSPSNAKKIIEEMSTILEM